MVLRDNDFCEHTSQHGGDERCFHRSANGFTRSILCKELGCDKAIIQTQRKDPAELWKYIVLIALGTKYGKKARARAIYQTVSQLRFEAKQLEERPASLKETLSSHRVPELCPRSPRELWDRSSPPSPRWSMILAPLAWAPLPAS